MILIQIDYLRAMLDREGPWEGSKKMSAKYRAQLLKELKRLTTTNEGNGEFAFILATLPFARRLLAGPTAAEIAATRVPGRASEIVKWAEGQGWKRMQTANGPIKYVDENGVVRATVKRGSSRTPGSGSPHVELRDAAGRRVDPDGNPVTRKSPENHTPIEWDLE